MKGRKVLVTGGAGFLGSHLCERLLESGAGVRVMDTFSSGQKGNLSHCLDRLEIYSGDVADEEMVRKATEDVEMVIYAAFPMAIREWSLETSHVTSALAGLLSVLKSTAARQAFIVYLSSIAVYGDQVYTPIDEIHPLGPVTLYGAVKLAGEHFCRVFAKNHGLRYAILRIADIYGPRNSRVSTPIQFLIQAIQKKNIVVYGTGNQSRTYTYVDDLVDAVLKLLNNPVAQGQIFNIAGDETVSIYELAQLVRKITGDKVDILFAPGVPADDRILAIENSKAKKILGFLPRFKIEEGLSLTHRWLIDNPSYYG